MLARVAGRLAHPRVSTLVLLVVLLPTLGVVATSSIAAASSWSYRSEAAGVQQDVQRLDGITRARVVFNSWVVPAQALSYSNGLGVRTAVLDSLFHLHFRAMLVSGTAQVEQDPVLRSSPALAGYLKQLGGVEPGILRATVPNTTVNSLYVAIAGRIENAWASGFSRLERDVAAWRPPGSFVEHVQTLRRTFSAYLDALNEVQYGNFVLNGRATPAQKASFVQASSALGAETAGLSQALGPRALAAWRAIRYEPSLASFTRSMEVALELATAGGRAPYANDISAYAADFRNGLAYLGALDKLVVASAADLTAATQSEQNAAAGSFAGEIAFLVLLAVIALGGALLLGRALSRPVRRLGEAAERLQQGDFALPPLPSAGPSELMVAAYAFNDMAQMLRSMESKVIALASEDLSDPVLQEPLPGRAGRALQRSVDHLTARVRERESHRLQLEEEATHDSLTGLLNRAAVLDVLSHDLSRRRGEGEVIAVLFVDLDGLKATNDTFGHDAGDEAIRATANALRSATRSGDSIARLGGDEFLVVLHVREEAEAEQVAARICRSVAEASFVSGSGEVSLSCSVGIAISEQGASSDPAKLVQAADKAMYDAKRRRREGQSGPAGRTLLPSPGKHLPGGA